MNRNKSLKRRKPHRKPKPRVLLVCEGKCTEPNYFHSLNLLLGSKVVLEFDSNHSAPKAIVETAAARKRMALKLSKSDPNERLEAVWCAFDRDDHPSVTDALHQAAANGILVAFSDPCFELWLLLHFVDQNAYIQRHAVAQLCEGYMRGYKKNPDMDLLLPNLTDAVARAETLCEIQRRNGNEGINPWTDVHVLVGALRQLGLPDG